ncbi:MAG: hypothetical protein KUA43_21890, partial [Hoeflea sp.]|uniref:hypothetical protein n=1 Tax=Hoeflea sp. TaxID=1940281 RepID=UPI001DEACBF5
ADCAQPLIPFVQIPEPRLPTHHPLPANQTSRIESQFAEKREVFRGVHIGFATFEHSGKPRGAIEGGSGTIQVKAIDEI